MRSTPRSVTLSVDRSTLATTNFDIVPRSPVIAAAAPIYRFTFLRPPRLPPPMTTSDSAELRPPIQ